MTLPVDGWADSDLSVKGLTTEELTIRSDMREFRKIQMGGGLMMRRMRMKACTLFNLAKKSCRLGICRSERLN